MKPKEKWERLTHPTCLADYHLGISRKEMMTFPEGRAIIKQIEADELIDKFHRNIMKAMGKAMSQMIEKDMLDIMDRDILEIHKKAFNSDGDNGLVKSRVGRRQRLKRLTGMDAHPRRGSL